MWKAVLAGTTALVIAGSSLVYAQQRDVPFDRCLDELAHRCGVIASIPVAARPMISFWICEVPS